MGTLPAPAFARLAPFPVEDKEPPTGLRWRFRGSSAAGCDPVTLLRVVGWDGAPDIGAVADSLGLLGEGLLRCLFGDVGHRSRAVVISGCRHGADATAQVMGHPVGVGEAVVASRPREGLRGSDVGRQQRTAAGTLTSGGRTRGPRAR